MYMQLESPAFIPQGKSVLHLSATMERAGSGFMCAQKGFILLIINLSS